MGSTQLLLLLDTLNGDCDRGELVWEGWERQRPSTSPPCRASSVASHRLIVHACRKCKLYRFDNDSGEWKERGAGQVRLLQSQDNGKIRLLMRQEKTLKIRANHFGAPLALAWACSLDLHSDPSTAGTLCTVHVCCNVMSLGVPRGHWHTSAPVKLHSHRVDSMVRASL